MDRLSLMFSFSSQLFERSGDKLNYVSLYFTKYTNGDGAISELANAIAPREKGSRRLALPKSKLLASRSQNSFFLTQRTSES